MSKTNLVILESPSKTNTIKSFLGSNYKVVASKGHVRDLPKSKLGVDVDDNFKAYYINIRGKGDLIKALKKDAKAAGKVYLATDPDREGEAISWHLAVALGIDPDSKCRISFNELTKSAVKEAVKAPRAIDMDLVNSQQARRILDRIVGYKISPFLWKSVRSGLSAGRVQSVTVRLIVDRENEIRAFIPEEYWTVEAELVSTNGAKFTAKYYGDGGKKKKLSNEEEASTVVKDASQSTFNITDVKKSVRKKNPAPPFTTSTLQQDASKKLGFQSQRIMKVAQELYEGINVGSEFGGTHGLITYMRTDSLRVSSEAQGAAKEFISQKYGEKYYPDSPNIYKTKAVNAQDAHEAIRPSDVRAEPSLIKKYLTTDQYKLYKLIWERFVASQMASALLDTVNAEFDAGGHTFRASGYTVAFPGFMTLYDYTPDGDGDEKASKLPPMAQGEKLKHEKITPDRHFTEPPPRYTEGSLVKVLEEKGIGRPSTYAPTITTVVSRGYIKREGKALIPTSLGELTDKIMKEAFSDIVNYEFTAKMEDDLDKIENGGMTLEKVLADFYGEFAKELAHAEEIIKKDEIELEPELSDIVCDKCGATMVIKNGRYGKFAACPNYPECKNIKSLGKDGKAAPTAEPPKPVEGMKCEVCGKGMVERTGRYGTFYSCEDYPTCKFTKQKNRPTGVKCPDCGGDIVTRRGKNKSVFFSCSNYPKCKYTSWDLPAGKNCPSCGKPLYVKKAKGLVLCKEKGCGYSEAYTENNSESNDENNN
jgi:DNA topoisomerase-1